MEFSDETLAKAAKLLDSDRVFRDSDYPNLWWVNGSADDPYRVQVGINETGGQVEYVTCTCPHGIRNGGLPKCYHAAAVLMKIGMQSLGAD